MSSGTSRVSVIRTTLSPDEKDLWELSYYAGVKFDPNVAKYVMELLHHGIHPDSILAMLEKMSEESKYSKVDKSALATGSGQRKLHKTDSSKKYDEKKKRSNSKSRNIDNNRILTSKTKFDR